MELIVTVVRHTPPPVFIALAVLVWIGVRALQPRTVSIWRILVAPAIFIAWGLYGVAGRAESNVALLAPWLFAATAGWLIGWATTRLHGLKVLAGGAIHLPGSPAPLIRNLFLFFARYGMAVAVALSTGPAERKLLDLSSVVVAGISAGYFIGWLARFARAYRYARTPLPSGQTG